MMMAAVMALCRGLPPAIANTSPRKNSWRPTWSASQAKYCSALIRGLDATVDTRLPYHATLVRRHRIPHSSFQTVVTHAVASAAATHQRVVASALTDDASACADCAARVLLR